MNKTQLIEFLKKSRNAVSDDVALQGKELYPEWRVGMNVEVGDRLNHGGKLYKALTAHTTQENWAPGQETASIWTVIDETHAGTLEDPIPASVNMEYVKGLYYIENGTIYLMNRQGMNDGDKVTLQYLPSQLVGQYFEVVSQ